jgi:hypothetical protein
MLTSAVEAAFLDAMVLPRDHLNIHLLLFVATLLAFVVGWTLVIDERPRLRGPLAAVALSVAAVSAVGFVRTPQPWRALMATGSPHQRLIATARQLLDRDGDGFSAVLGGGDCDDDDRTAFPLSTIGRDCTGWMGPATSAAPAPPAPATAVPAPPTTVVLVTIDAFRCGFGAGAPPLRDACPSLTRLAGQGWSRLDAHANYPVTARSMTALHTGDLYANPERPVPRPTELASFYRAHGYATRAVVTHRYTLADQAVRSAFDHIDETLAPVASRPSGVTSERVTDRVLDLLAGAHAPTFVWVHYFDPHAPYVVADGDVLTTDDAATYALEVQRTDAAIGRLTDALARRPDAGRTLVFVSADHGEAFGEHGIRHHGRDLHEEVLRVPMIAWTAGGSHRAIGDERLPVSTVQVAGYLERLLTGAAAEPQQPVFARIRADGDPQMAVIDGGHKLIYHRGLNFLELYDLTRDPDEQTDLAAREPAEVARLGRELAAFYRGMTERKARDLHLLGDAVTRR